MFINKSLIFASFFPLTFILPFFIAVKENLREEKKLVLESSEAIRTNHNKTVGFYSFSFPVFHQSQALCSLTHELSELAAVTGFAVMGHQPPEHVVLQLCAPADATMKFPGAIRR